MAQMTMLSDIYTIWAREMIRFVRQRARLISSLAMPVFWLVFIGNGFGGSIKLPGMDYTKLLAPGIIGMSLLFTGLFALARGRVGEACALVSAQ